MTRVTARAINKPKLIAGIDRQWFGVSLVLAGFPCMVLHSLTGKLVAAAMFLILCGIGAWVYKDDNRFLTVIGAYARHWIIWPFRFSRVAIYDPGKQIKFRVVIKASDE
jgi:type IV secretory pathway VirB3-like protein